MKKIFDYIVIVIILLAAAAVYVSSNDKQILNRVATYEQVIKLKRKADRHFLQNKNRLAKHEYLLLAQRCRRMTVSMNAITAPNEKMLQKDGKKPAAKKFENFYLEEDSYQQLEIYALVKAAYCMKKSKRNNSAALLCEKALYKMSPSMEKEWTAAAEMLAEITGTGFQDYPTDE